MNYGALIFLAGFVALTSSWVGLVFAPQMQVGRQSLTADQQYPPRRPGLAEQGAQVYRANGCAECHSQQVRQTGVTMDVVLSDAGTNQPAVLAALQKIGSPLDAGALAALPKDALRSIEKPKADEALAALKDTGAKFSVRIRPTGLDIDKWGWGRRGNVAQDYLQDAPVFLGSQRLGPDLANIGVRQPDPTWHLMHLYAPTNKVAGSTMPPYRFLFEKRKIDRQPSPDALPVPVEAGYEIVPTDKARALVAYLQSLHSDVPLFEAPFSAQ